MVLIFGLNKRSNLSKLSIKKEALLLLFLIDFVCFCGFEFYSHIENDK